jgi:hypothetical protein
MDKHTDLNGYYHDGGVTKRQMRGLAFFAEKFADPEFELGHFQATPVVKNGPRKPIFILSDIANDFVTFCINERVVDLRIEADAQMSWGKFAIGGVKALADANASDLVPLITHILGNEIHWQSRLINAFQIGALQQILNRGAELAYPEYLPA